MNGFGFDLQLEVRGAGVTLPVAAVSGLSVLSGIAGEPAIRMDGGMAYAELPFVAGATFDPGKIVLTVSDPGFDAEGATSVVRTIRGRKILRNQYPAHGTLKAANDAGTFKVYFSLEEPVYAGSTVTGALAEFGYYGAAPGGRIVGAGNASTRAYPKPVMAWANLQFERATAAGLPVELFCSHIHGRNGQMVARVEFIGKDPAGNSVSVFVSAPALSSIQTKGQIAEAFKAVVPVTPLDQGGGCKVNARVYPWIGTAFDLELDGAAWPTSCPQTVLNFYNDKTGGYGGACACVKNGAAGGTVQASLASARATPFPNIVAALNAIAAWNGSNKGHADLGGGTVYVMDDNGAEFTATMTTNTTAAAGLTWCTVRPDPANTATVYYSDGAATSRSLPTLIDWRVNIRQSRTDQVFTIGTYAAGGTTMFAANDISVEFLASSTRPWAYRPNYMWQRNVSYSGAAYGAKQPATSSIGTDFFQCLLALGVTAPVTAQVEAKPYAMIGCAGQLRLMVPEATQGSHDGALIYNNRLSSLNSVHDLRGRTYLRGLHIVQNMLEVLGTVGALNVGADGSVPSIDNVLVAYNTVVGDRYNHAYTDDDALAGAMKWVVNRFNIFQEFNIKSDATSGTVANRSGNWMSLYHVGNRGNVVQNGAAGPDNAPGSGSWLGETWPEASGFNVGLAGTPFVSYQARNQETGTVGPGDGDYRLSGAVNAAYAKVPTGLAMLGRDLAGVARNLGAAGAFERTQP